MKDDDETVDTNCSYPPCQQRTDGQHECSKGSDLYLKDYPKDSPPRYNGQNHACDMLVGPCSCGAWHHGE